MAISKYFVVLILAALAGVPPAAAGNTPTTAKTILVFGDSLSAGFGINQDAGWVNLLQQKLRQNHPDYRVVNASISGDTSLGGRNRIAQALAAQRPAIVIIELGGNDGLRGLPLGDMEKNLSAIIVASQRTGAQVLLVGMMLPPNYGPDYVGEFFTVYGTLARRHRTAYLPFLLQGIATRMELIQDDGIHPKAEAQPLILDNVWPVLEKLLAPPRGG